MINLDEILLTEITTYNSPKMIIAVTGSGLTVRNFAQKPYFKVYSGPSVASSTKVARIYFDEPAYVYPEHKEAGKQPWYFNSKERKMLNDILDINIWGRLVFDLNQVTRLNVWYDKPDYTKLKEGTNHDKQI